MRQTFTLCLAAMLFMAKATGQTAITAVNASSKTAATQTTYTIGANTYNWGVPPNNAVDFVDGFTAGGKQFSFTPTVTGSVKLRRVDNAQITGNFSLVWARASNAGNVYNMLPAYEADMESYFNTNSLSKGTDNLFQNATGENINNVERLDWLLDNTYQTPHVDRIGFAVFERGASGGHDPFCIAAVKAVDVNGDPSGYGPVVRINSSNYGTATAAFAFNVLKAPFPGNLAYSTTLNQSIGGVFISLQTLGIAADEPVYGYSLFGADLPAGATPADLVDYTNATFFPRNTGNPGGIDLAAIMGVFTDNSVLPVTFTGVTASLNNNVVNVKWSVENETHAAKYQVERSADGVNFQSVGSLPASNKGSNTAHYSYADNVLNVAETDLYYRIRQYDLDGSYYFSKTVLVRRSIQQNSARIFPNPVRNMLSVTVESPVQQELRLTVANASGQQLITSKQSVSSGKSTINVEGVSQLAPGVYTLTISNQSNEKTIERFVKQ